MSHEHPTKTMCEVLEVSRSGYYRWQSARASARALQTKVIRAKIASVHEASRGTCGSPRVTAALHKQGEAVGRNRVARLMKEAGLQGRQARRYRVQTTDSAHNEPIAPNLLPKASVPTKPDEVWVTDITYVETGEGWLYLARELDLYSRRLIGWAMG
jgi:transposase InsO family protein